MLTSLIIPCYNEEQALPILYRSLWEVVEELGKTSEFEFIFVDDGSRDGTLRLLKELADQDERVAYLAFSRNFGKEAAMYAGLKNARGDYVAIMDADMQDPPSLLPEMFRLMEEGYDSVATRRVSRAGEPRLRSLGARMFYRVINRISDADIVDGARDFRLMKREMVDAVVAMSEYHRFSKGIFGWVGFRTCWLPFENVERAAGETKWSFWGLLKYSVEGIINFSQAPFHRLLVRHRAHGSVLSHGAVYRGEKAPLWRPGSRMAVLSLHYRVFRGDSAPLHGHHGPVYRQNLHGSKGPPPLHHRRDESGWCEKNIVRFFKNP